jgi:hypothetical protein
MLLHLSRRPQPSAIAVFQSRVPRHFENNFDYTKRFDGLPFILERVLN